MGRDRRPKADNHRASTTFRPPALVGLRSANPTYSTVESDPMDPMDPIDPIDPKDPTYSSFSRSRVVGAWYSSVAGGLVSVPRVDSF